MSEIINKSKRITYVNIYPYVDRYLERNEDISFSRLKCIIYRSNPHQNLNLPRRTYNDKRQDLGKFVIKLSSRHYNFIYRIELCTPNFFREIEIYYDVGMEKHLFDYVAIDANLSLARGGYNSEVCLIDYFIELFTNSFMLGMTDKAVTNLLMRDHITSVNDSSSISSGSQTSGSKKDSAEKSKDKSKQNGNTQDPLTSNKDVISSINKSCNIVTNDIEYLMYFQVIEDFIANGFEEKFEADDKVDESILNVQKVIKGQNMRGDLIESFKYNLKVELLEKTFRLTCDDDKLFYNNRSKNESFDFILNTIQGDFKTVMMEFDI